MQTRCKGMKAATGVAGMLAALILAGTAHAVDVIDDPIQIDERAAQIVQTSNSLCWEMHRYHQQNPDYAQAYRAAKLVWAQAGSLRDALRAGPVETEALAQQAAQMNENLAQVEQAVARWGDGDRSQVPLESGPGGRAVMVDRGVSVRLPLLGVHVGGPRYVVTDEGVPALARRRLHPNSHGSRKSLERELAAARTAVNYLMEDAGVSIAPNAAAPENPGAKGPVPQPPDAGLGEPVKVSPPSAKIPAPTSGRK
ncbi:MAG: hypothetical protein ACM3U2_11755 [Deltaproteobacteria bacterium]